LPLCRYFLFSPPYHCRLAEDARFLHAYCGYAPQRHYASAAMPPFTPRFDGASQMLISLLPDAAAAAAV